MATPAPPPMINQNPLALLSQAKTNFNQLQRERKEAREREDEENRRKGAALAIEKEMKTLSEEREQWIGKYNTCNAELQRVNGLLTEKTGDFDELATAKKTQDNLITANKVKLKELQEQIDSLTREKSKYRDMAQGDRPNSLPKRFNGAKVVMTNLGSQMAIDSGADSGARAHGWEYNKGNHWQTFKLVCNAGDSWTITHWGTEDCLMFREPGNGAKLFVGPPHGNRNEHWYINTSRYPGAWMIKNRDYDTAIMLDSSAKTDGFVPHGALGL